MPTTEIALIPLKPDIALGDPSHPSAATWKYIVQTLHSQPGFQRLHFGTRVESPSELQMLIDWNSLSDHQTFMASDAYQPFLGEFGKIMAGSPSIHHVDFGGELSKALSAPVTEIATFYCDGEPGSEWLGNARKAGEWLEGSSGMAFGIMHEEVEHKSVKGRAAVIAIGWESKEAHMAFRETQGFKENIGLLRGEAKAIEMHHVVFMEALE